MRNMKQNFDKLFNKILAENDSILQKTASNGDSIEQLQKETKTYIESLGRILEIAKIKNQEKAEDNEDQSNSQDDGL